MTTNLYLLTVVNLLGFTTSAAEAKDFEAMKAEKEARKKALREAAGEIKTSGKDVDQVGGWVRKRFVQWIIVSNLKISSQRLLLLHLHSRYILHPLIFLSP